MSSANDRTAVDPSSTPVALDVPYERFLDCVHCGLCLNYCPTYVETGNEADSPRGRIHILRALADGRMDYSDGVRQHLDLCLGCLACETACPSGVHYHEIIEAGRQLVRDQSPGPPHRRMMERILYSPDNLERSLAPLQAARRLGIEKLVRAVGKKLPAGLGEMIELLPELPRNSLRKRVPAVVPAVGEMQQRVGLLTGCVMSVFFTRTNLATIHVLAHNGCEVHIPPGQECCGALAIHSGARDTGRELARRTIDMFEGLELSAIVVNAAGCGSSMKEYGRLLAGDQEYAEKAARFGAKVVDAAEYLAGLPIRFPHGAPDRERLVTYHDACHLVHGQKVRTQPREVLDAMPGVKRVELAESDWCCGSAGTYNITQPLMAERLARRKVNHIMETGAEIVVSGNPGCNLQIQKELQDAGSRARVMHTMDLLAAAYPDPAPGLPAEFVPGMEESAP